MILDILKSVLVDFNENQLFWLFSVMATLIYILYVTEARDHSLIVLAVFFDPQNIGIDTKFGIFLMQY